MNDCCFHFTGLIARLHGVSHGNASGVSPIFGLLFISGFFAIWCLAAFSFSRKSKWNIFATRYPARIKPAGVTYRPIRATFKSGPHSQVYSRIPVIFTEGGIYFYFGSLAMIARIFHKPFLLPWKGVRKVKKSGWPVDDLYELTIKDNVANITLLFDKNIEGDLAKFKALSKPG